VKLALVLFALAACGGKRSAPPPPPAGAKIGAALVASLDAADRARAPWRCGLPTGPGLASETITTKDGAAFQLAGHVISVEKASLDIGVIADAGGAAPPTLAALGQLRGKLEGVDLVLTLGGMGTTQADLEATLGTLADGAPYLLVALPGELEGAGAQSAAVVALRTKGASIVDGRLARRIELPKASIALVTGAAYPQRLVAGTDGCVYSSLTVATTINELVAREGLRILAATAAPRHLVNREATGELALGGTYDIAVHPPIGPRPSAATTGARDSKSIALSPGIADATTRLPDGRGVPSAGILTITGTTWKWRPVTAE
jgi:hypothetical protein